MINRAADVKKIAKQLTGEIKIGNDIRANCPSHQLHLAVRSKRLSEEMIKEIIEKIIASFETLISWENSTSL